MKESYALTEADTPVSPTSKKTYAEIVVNRPIIQRRKSDEGGKSSLVLETHLDTRLKTFHYHIPEALQTSLKPGHLVAVPFRHQVLQGVVVALHDHSPVQKTRPIQSILDPLPIVQASQLELAQWLAQQYLAPLTKCINYFLPPGANRQPQTVIEPITDIPLPSDLTPLERALHLYLQQQTKPSLLEDLEAKVVDGLIKKGLARRRTTLSKPKVGPKVERTVEMLISADEIDDALLTLGRQTKQAEILTHFLTLEDPLPTVSEICDAIGCTVSPVQALIDKEWLIHHPKQQLITIKPDVSQAELETIPSDFTNIVDQLEQHQAPRSLIELGLNTQSLQDLEALNIFVRFEEPERISLNLEPELLPLAISQVRGTARHAEVLHLLTQEDEPVWIGWIYAQTEATTKTLQDLNKAGLIAFDESRRWRDPLTGRSFTLNSPPQLTAEQADLWSEIKPNLDQHYKPYLLHGVTGSGKTEIYLRAIDYVLAQKKQAIFLVPEVMLATQIVDRVQARFPDQVALWHSSLSPGERFDTWERVRAGELPIIVGPRSALFSPVQNLGLIVIDEEHEHAYKQDQAPTFHLREAAIEYARLCDIPVIMGSATPDVVSYRKAQRGQYQLLTLPNRILAHQRHLAVQAALLKRSRNKANTAQANNHHFVSLPMPPVELIDLRDELRAGNRSIFSRALSDGIRQTLAAGEQVIIFLNRRGTATFVNCRDCGHVVDCPRCDTNLTYHAPGEKLICHYCGYQQNNPETCPVCNSSRIRYFGLGTERVEAALRRTFPEAKPLRFDQDTTRKSGSHYTFLQHFVEGRANVMIGTQMVAKGLDLPLVTLVGVISADTALYLPDFRSAERTFQVLMQVAGRAGRSPLGGRVIVQTYTPDHPAIIAASEHDYEGFYNEELYFRYEQGYPPFKRLARLRYSGSGYQQSRQAAQDLVDKLKLWVDQQGFPAVEIIGPTPTYVQRLRAKFRWQIIIHAPDPAEVIGPVPLPIGWQVDIDPVNLL